MSESIRLDLVGVTGTYVNRDGETKKRYVKCGSIWVYTENGKVTGASIVADATPVATPDKDGNLRMNFSGFPPQNQGGNGGGGGDRRGNSEPDW